MLKAEEELARKKFDALNSILSDMGSVLVAFSAGVDSTFLLKAACLRLGVEKVAALTATSPTYIDSELSEAKKLASEFGVRHIIEESNELQIPGFAENPSNRCYFCKTELFAISAAKALALGLNWAADGSNIDDAKDVRPGKTAAREKNIRSPLEEAGLTKAEIRFLSRELGLRTWNKPNLACLSSRFPYGTRITEDGLEKVRLAEDFLRSLGIRQLRVRCHGDTARIEADEEGIRLLLDHTARQAAAKRLKELGFTYITVDIEGYRTGSMNEPLLAAEKKRR